MQFTIFQESRKGSRKINQDRIAYSYSRDALLMVVADGMGGHMGGEIAAQIAVRLLIDRFQQEAKPALRNPHLFLQESFLRAHAALADYANQFSMLESPRTTCIACIVQGNYAYWSHAGDSRLYLLRRGKMISQTRDHSKVQYLVEQGLITAQAATKHQDRNKIYSCLGGILDPVIDLSRRTPVQHGDVFVLCTDGVWSVINAQEFSLTFEKMPLLAAAALLLEEAEKRGGPEGDNLSMIAMHWGAETTEEEVTTTGSTITETMPLGEFATQMEKEVTLTQPKDGGRDFTEEEIEKAIAEIQATIKRYGGK